MSQPKVHIIHLQNTDHSVARIANVERQLAEQGIWYYNIWPGIKDMPVYKGIGRAHKQVVQWAATHGVEEICIMEDDVQFLGRGAFDFFIKHKPAPYDLYLGCASNVLKKEGEIIKDFRGLLLYMVHERFYDTFLSLPENQHVDAMLKDKGDYYMCPKVVAEEMPGYSYNRKRVLDRRYLINSFEKYHEEKDAI